MTKSNRVLEYKKKYNELPKLNITFCGNRVVVSAHRPCMAAFGKEFSDHTDVSFGVFFAFRLAWACIRVFKRNFSQ